MLLLEANRVVSSDRLIDALWDESPPAQPRKTLQVYVSQLRKAVGRDRIETRSPGYLLHVADDEFDLHRVQQLASRGGFRQALGLFRDRPLAEFESERFASVEVARLEELRLACLEDRIDRDAVDYAATSDFLHSHAEALTDLAEALALAGRREEAASAIDTAIRLHEEKGNVLAVAQTRTLLENLPQTDGRA